VMKKAATRGQRACVCVCVCMGAVGGGWELEKRAKISIIRKAPYCSS